MTNNKTVGYSCVYAPIEILESFGLLPQRQFGSIEALDVADSYIHPNLCGYVKNILSASLGMNMLFVDTCTQMKRLHDSWQYFFSDRCFSYLLNLPRISTPEARAFFVESMKDLIGFLEKQVGTAFSLKSLGEAIKKRNALRKSLLEAEALLLEGKATSSDYLLLVHSVQREGVEEAQRRAEQFVGSRLRRPQVSQQGPRLLLKGSPISGIDLTKVIEDQGAQIVFFDTCDTARSYNTLVDEGKEPLEALAEKYLTQSPCPRMYNAFERFDQLGKIIDEAGIDGVIYHTLKFCDMAIYESHPFKEFIEAKGLPILRIESEYDFKLPGQMATRMQAFLEML